MIMDFIQNNLSDILTVLSTSLVAGQGFFIVFKNLKINHNFKDLEKSVNKLTSGDLKEVSKAIKDLTIFTEELLTETREAVKNMLKDFEENRTNAEADLTNYIDNKINSLEVQTKLEVDRIIGKSERKWKCF